MRLIANKGLAQAVRTDGTLLPGINTYRGRLTCRPVAEDQGLPHADVRELLTA